MATALSRAVVFLASALLWAAGGAPAAAQATQVVPFPDVPPWHWAYDAVVKAQRAGIFVGYPTTPAELAENSIVQVFAGFAHARASGAREWVERFTYNRPANWPAPLERSSLASFPLRDLRVSVEGDRASASFTATMRDREGRTQTAPMRVALRYNGQDWQVDYGTLEAASPLFR